MSFASMRGQTLFVGNLVGEGIGIDFSDGSVQTTAYPGNLTSGATIPNQIIIKNSTNSTEAIISAGQTSTGTLSDNYVYYTATNPAEPSSTCSHIFVGNAVNINGILNISGPTALNSNLTVLGTSSLEGITGSSL